jgi:hypothetical protein
MFIVHAVELMNYTHAYKYIYVFYCLDKLMLDRFDSHTMDMYIYELISI